MGGTISPRDYLSELFQSIATNAISLDQPGSTVEMNPNRWIQLQFLNTLTKEILHECIEALFSIARIAQYGLEDTLDELLCSFCKFTTLLNPYASAEETLYAFSHDIKPKMAMMAVFTIANTFKDSIRGGWRTIIECLLKLKRLKLLPQSLFEMDNASNSLTELPMEKLESALLCQVKILNLATDSIAQA
ncbi:ARF guanine-nucleotide exchange factor GNL2 [Sesamum angolense]|uniref:ARF guanine-nucleotide exchange factor GNL2 n=1 Tax=Sesamum angolense TaxID=2727404 RepID=A0AAE1WLE9_9LAMI|nr:ARF guanine-nucleotide exchange factor GNL2 [Sesamum angolense]